MSYYQSLSVRTINYIVVKIAVLSIVGVVLLGCINSVSEAGKFSHERNLRTKTNRVKRISSETMLSELEKLIESYGESRTIEIGERELLSLKSVLRSECETVLKKLEKENSDSAREIIERYQLESLRTELRGRGLPKTEPLAKTYRTFLSDEFGISTVRTRQLSLELRRYLTVEQASRNENLGGQFKIILENLLEKVRDYIVTGSPTAAAAIAEANLWLNDLGSVVPEINAVIELLHSGLDNPNLYFEVRENLLSSVFERKIEEQTAIRENILGSDVRGIGNVSGNSRVKLVPNAKEAELKVIVDAQLTSSTVARQKMVAVFTDNYGPMRSEKTLWINPEEIRTRSAYSRASIKSITKGTRIDAGPIIREIAKHQIKHQKPVAEAEGKKRTEFRFSEQVNGIVDPQIERANCVLCESIREPLIAAGLLPRRCDLRTDENTLYGEISLGSRSQVLAVGEAPGFEPEIRDSADLFLQVHQSAPNNSAMSLLSGKTINEEKIIEDIVREIGDFGGRIARDSDEPPLTVGFARGVPISVKFENNRINVTIRFNRFVRAKQSYPALDIVISYEISRDGETGKPALVQESVQVNPPGYDPEKNESISARAQFIRTVVVSRLEKALPQKIVLEGQTFSGRTLEDGTVIPPIGKIEPVHFEAKDGWLSIAWKFNRAEPE